MAIAKPRCDITRFRGLRGVRRCPALWGTSVKLRNHEGVHATQMFGEIAIGPAGAGVNLGLWGGRDGLNEGTAIGIDVCDIRSQYSCATVWHALAVRVKSGDRGE